MKDAKTSNKPAYEVEMRGKSNKRLMAYVTATAKLSKMKKPENSK